MKKYVIGLFSLLLFIIPVSAEDIRLISNNNQISFENISNSTNLTYLQTNYQTLTVGNNANVYHTFLSIYDEGSVLSYPYKFYVSDFTGYSYNLNISDSVFTQSSNNQYIGDSKIGGYGLLSISKNGYYYDPDSLQLFYSRYTSGDYSGNNPLISFGNNINTGVRTYLNNSYLRVFYSDNFNWYSDTITPGVNTQKNTPFNYELFTLGSNFFNTKYFSVLLPGRFNGTFYTPNYSYGFSYVDALTGYTWNTLKFYTVFPFFDYEFTSTGVYSVPDWGYTNQFYMFRFDGLSAGSDFSHLAVIGKCNSYFCNGTGLYSDMLYSEYYCNGLSLNESTKYINFSEKCTLINGGIVKNILPFTNSTGVVSISFVSNNFLSNILSYFNSPQLNGINGNVVYPQDYTYNGFGNFYINNNKLCYKVASYYRFNFSSFNDVCYNIVSTSNGVIPDFLTNYDNTESDPADPVPPEPLTSGSVNDSIKDKCINNNTFFQLNTLLCNSMGVGVGDTITDNNQCFQRTVVYNVDGGITYERLPCGYPGGDHIVVDNSGHVFITCTGSDCISNVVSDYYYNSGSSIVSGSYYESDNFFFSCPYPIYSGRFISKISNVVNLGDFDLSLPIQCYYSAFMNGKTKVLFSGLVFDNIQILGSISGDTDERRYLFPFLDFILSLGLLIFLLKLYHLFK